MTNKEEEIIDIIDEAFEFGLDLLGDGDERANLYAKALLEIIRVIEVRKYTEVVTHESLGTAPHSRY